MVEKSRIKGSEGKTYSGGILYIKKIVLLMEDFSFFRLRFFGTTIIHSLAVSLYMVALFFCILSDVMGGCSSLYIFVGIEADRNQFSVLSSRGDKTEYRGKTNESTSILSTFTLALRMLLLYQSL